MRISSVSHEMNCNGSWSQHKNDQMEDYRSVLLLVFSKDAPLERVAGMKGVVRLLVDFTTLDTKWDHLWETLYHNVRAWSFVPCLNRGVMDHFLERISYDPIISNIQRETTIMLLQFCRRVSTEKYPQVKCEYLNGILPRLFDAFKYVTSLKDHSLAQAVFATYGELLGENRFAYREIGKMDFENLTKIGVEILSVREDFKQLKVVLRTTRDERVDIEIRLNGKYPIDDPSFHFVGKLRPTLYAGRDHVFVPLQFTRMYEDIEGIEGCLRFMLVHMEYGGVDESF
jgi:hypothetical protein